MFILSWDAVIVWNGFLALLPFPPRHPPLCSSVRGAEHCTGRELPTLPGKVNNPIFNKLWLRNLSSESAFLILCSSSYLTDARPWSTDGQRRREENNMSWIHYKDTQWYRCWLSVRMFFWIFRLTNLEQALSFSKLLRYLAFLSFMTGIFTWRNLFWFKDSWISVAAEASWTTSATKVNTFQSPTLRINKINTENCPQWLKCTEKTSAAAAKHIAVAAPHLWQCCFSPLQLWWWKLWWDVWSDSVLSSQSPSVSPLEQWTQGSAFPPLFKGCHRFLRMGDARMSNFKREKLHLSGAVCSDECLKSNSSNEEVAEMREQREYIGVWMRCFTLFITQWLEQD